MNVLDTDDLVSGDIFLTYFEGPTKEPGDNRSDRQVYVDEATYLVKALTNRQDPDLHKCANLLRYLITKFDGDTYYHAALFLDGLGVCEASVSNGVSNRKLLGDSADWVTDAFAFAYYSQDQDAPDTQKNPTWLGSKDLPIGPIRRNADDLIALDLPYGTKPAILMAAICILRRWTQMQGKDAAILHSFLAGTGLA